MEEYTEDDCYEMSTPWQLLEVLSGSALRIVRRFVNHIEAVSDILHALEERGVVLTEQENKKWSKATDLVRSYYEALRKCD